jgi:ADP-ribosyl-[dinitrogen reductase] hydrolase
LAGQTDIRDRALGCILGGAIGDALGGPYEGKRPPVELHDEARLSLSDDTQLTLATCEAVVEAGGRVDPELVASRFAAWHRRGHVTGVGASTYKALTELAAGGHWALSGAKGERAAGNGAAMRVAPVAFLLDPSEESERRTIRDVCRITHHHEEAYAGALAVIVALRAAFSGEWQRNDDLLDVVIRALPDSGVRDRLETLKGLGPDIQLSEVGARFGASGYVVESVPFAIYGAQRVHRLGFQGLLKELIRAGGDTDTVSSIAGQICGAYLGVSSLPSELLEKLPEKSLVEDIAKKFADKLG